MQDIKSENRIVSDWLLYYPERKKQHDGGGAYKHRIAKLRRLHR